MVLDWLTVTPDSGDGNGSLSVSATSYGGRESKQTSFKVQSTDGGSTATVNVTQEGLSEFVTFSSGTSSIGKEGGTLQLTGTSNSTALTFSIEEGGSLKLTAPATYKVLKKDVDNGEAIVGDPGASATYGWSISFAVPANMTTGSLTCTVTVADAGSSEAGKNIHSCVVTQAAGDAYVYVGVMNQSSISVTLPAAGGNDTVEVLSNTTWAVSGSGLRR